MTGFTPIHGLVGGAVIGLALAVMLIATGRIAGLCGVIAGLFRADDRPWRAFFVAGMVAAGAAFELASPGTFDAAAPHSLPVVAVSGVLVGFGTRLSNGCTSGHGLCGMARLSKRSIVATMTFVGVAVATATVVGRLS